jgi:predicted ArsR family transcriptional regulator
MSDSKSPVRLILEYLETHEDVSAKEAAAVSGHEWDNDARRMLRALERRGLLERNWKVKRGAMRFTKGRDFAQWRDFEGNGFQTDVLAKHQFAVPGLLRPTLSDLW